MDSEESNKIIKDLENNIYSTTDRIVFIAFGKVAIKWLPTVFTMVNMFCVGEWLTVNQWSEQNKNWKP